MWSPCAPEPGPGGAEQQQVFNAPLHRGAQAIHSRSTDRPPPGIRAPAGRSALLLNTRQLHGQGVNTEGCPSMPTVAPSTLLQHTNAPRHRMQSAEHHRLTLKTPSRGEMDGRLGILRQKHKRASRVQTKSQTAWYLDTPGALLRHLK